jgi:hypothetical protein
VRTGHEKIFEYVYRSGATHWVQVRIPKDLRWAYPEEHAELLENLHTANPGEAKAVDDDDSVRESLPDLLREFGLASEVFATPSDSFNLPLSTRRHV